LQGVVRSGRDAPVVLQGPQPGHCPGSSGQVAGSGTGVPPVPREEREDRVPCPCAQGSSVLEHG